jgi:hypothetical protein
MSVLLVLVVVLPIVLLGVGVSLGLGLARWIYGRRQAAAGTEGMAVKQPKQASESALLAVHVVASAGTPAAPVLVALQDRQPSNTGTGTLSPTLSSQRLSPPGGSSTILGLADFAADSPLPSPAASPTASPLGYHKRGPSLELGRLMRAGTSVLSQVMDELDTRSAIMRLMSDGVNVLPSPQVGDTDQHWCAPA